MFFYGCLYERGTRSSNQDSIALHKFLTKYGETILAVVCDGMGGMEEGETASGYVAEKMSCWFYEELPAMLEKRSGRKGIARAMCRKLFRLHTELKEYGKKKKISCGTTASILLVHENRYLVCHIGDSMIYRMDRRLLGRIGRNGGSVAIKRLTAIHGNATDGLERCIGIGKYIQPEIMSGRVGKNTSFLLGSDGLGHHLTAEELKNAFSDANPGNAAWAEKRLRALAAKALRRGETDNISAIYLGQSTTV